MTENERRIVDAAKGLFLKFGYAKVTIGEVAKASGVSRPTVYQSFANKDEVFLGILEDFNRVSFEKIERVLEEGGSFVEMAGGIFQIWTIEPYVMLSQSEEAAEFVNCKFPFAQEAFDAAYAQIERYLEQALEKSGVSLSGIGMSTSQLAHLLTSTMRGLKSSAKNREDLESMVGQWLSVVETANEVT